ncbi:hypothetical protein DRQ07_01665 [candidate division KSB1 bacterium]|nr:MAG: hypothetical protein DRQ07_01665 [candidate division KSB1 bacterium]
MPLISQSIKGLITLKASSKLLSGDKLSALVTAISNATAQYVLSAAIVNSTNIALGPGSGTQTGRISGLVPNTMSSLMMLKASSAGLSGRDIRKLLDAVSFGVVNSMKSVLLQGVIIGAGPGTGTSKITGLSTSALQKLILAQSFFRQISGNKLRALISAMSFGIINHIMLSGIVNITDIGVAASPPVGPVTIPTAPGTGRLV